MLELIGRQWCWRPTEAGSMESVEEAISNVEVYMDDEESRLEFSTNKPAFNLNIMPSIDLLANGHPLTVAQTKEKHPKASIFTANVRDINKKSHSYFGVATSDIILRERGPPLGIFSDCPSHTIKRDDKDIYGEITSVEIHCVGGGRSFHLTGKVSLIDYKAKGN